MGNVLLSDNKNHRVKIFFLKNSYVETKYRWYILIQGRGYCRIIRIIEQNIYILIVLACPNMTLKIFSGNLFFTWLFCWKIFNFLFLWNNRNKRKQSFFATNKLNAPNQGWFNTLLCKIRLYWWGWVSQPYLFILFLPFFFFFFLALFKDWY